jgi:uncharacterized repeat protein (TIGR01451 family)
MKSFGVRLAAGATTILFGAYAAALAQKDKQDTSNTWTASVPSLGAPAAPIADVGADASWLSDPSKSLQQAASDLVESAQPAAGPVQLVQHTEPVEPADDGAGPAFDTTFLPATFGEAPADEPAEVPSDESADQGPRGWGLPAGDGSADPGALTTPAMMMTFPGDSTSSQAGASAGPPENALRGTAAASNSLREAGDAGNTNLAELAESAFPGRNSATPEPSTNHFDAVASGPAFGAATMQENTDAAMPTTAAAGLGSPTAIGLPQPFDAAAEAPVQLAPAPLSPMEGFSGAALSGAAFEDPTSNPGPAAADTRTRGSATVPGFPSNYQPTAMAQPLAAAALDPQATIDSPGDRRLEGAQSPSVVIQKRAPGEVKVGKPASFVIHVQNVGTVEALDVQIHDRIPAGMRLVDASPTPGQQGDVLFWQLGSMQAGEERTVTMQLVPEQEGELGSVARVSFEAAASVRTLSTRPELKIVQHAPETVLIGQQLEIELEVSNPGSGEATGVVLQEDVPEGLEHPKGRQLDNGLGNLAPGEVRNQILRLRAVAPGVVQNTIRLTGDDGLTAEHTVNVEVIAPQLQVELSGPSRRFLERQATCQLNIANVGTAEATNIEISVQLDRGFTFVSTDYEGQYDPSRHAVYWSLARLPAGGTGTVPLTLLPVEEGEQAIVIDARADLGVVAKSERKMTVEGFASLSFAITNPGGPIEMGSETDYEVLVTNNGSKADSNVRVQLQLPAGLELVSADSEAGTDGRGMVAFQPKSQLPPGEQLKYRLRLRGVAPGTHLVRAVVVSDQSSVPVTKEESTLVYADQ